MISDKLKEQLVQSVVQLEDSRGKLLKIKEMITRTTDCSFNRHSSTMSILKMELESAGWAISGGKLMLLGRDDLHYEVCFDLVVEVQIEDFNISFKERYTDRYHRHTMIMIED